VNYTKYLQKHNKDEGKKETLKVKWVQKTTLDRTPFTFTVLEKKIPKMSKMSYFVFNRRIIKI